MEESKTRGARESVVARFGLVLVRSEMAEYKSAMEISVTDFKHRCLEVIRLVEKTGQPVAITRRGKMVARLAPSSSTATSSTAREPWERLRELGGRLLANPGESVLKDAEFEVLR